MKLRRYNNNNNHLYDYLNARRFQTILKKTYELCNQTYTNFIYCILTQIPTQKYINHPPTE